jgi:hypothetical protein
MRGNKRAKMKVGAKDVAKAANVCYRTALAHEKAGKWKYGDLKSMARYVVGRVGE